MDRYAVQVVWTMVSPGSDTHARDEEFRQRIVPGVAALPGFIRGVWARSADGTRAHNTFVFENRDGVDALVAQIEENKPHSAAAGVHLHSLEIMDVLASI